MKHQVEHTIAWRYLFSKKSHNAINIVSGVSAAAVCVVTAAMVCVLSVMNGFGVVIEQMFSNFDPQIRITATNGKYFDCDSPTFQQVRQMTEVSIFSETIEETALVEFSDKQIPARIKGVDSLFQQLTQIDSILVDGYFSVYDGAFERSVLGQGLASQLSIGARFVHGLHLYAPKRNHKVNLLRPDESFNQSSCFIAGIFAVNQVKYDDQLMLVSLDMAQHLFDYAPHQVTAVELRLQDGFKTQEVKQQIRQILGDDFSVLDRYEQQEDFFRILRIEKLLTGVLIAFIMLIAAFNIIGSLTMLVLDKKEDILILNHLGATPQLIRRIFLYEGWLISSLGALIGLVLGLVLCLLQEHFGLLRLGSGTEYILSAYPVSVELPDLIIVILVVLGIGFVAAWIPSRHIKIHP